MDEIKNDFSPNKKKIRKSITKWLIFILAILIITFIVGIGHIPLYVYSNSNNAWGEYREIVVITLNGTIKEKIDSVTGYYDDNDKRIITSEKSLKKQKISKEEVKKLLELSSSISSEMTPENDMVFCDAGNYNEWALNLSELSYIKIEEGPSYRRHNPTAVSFNDYVDELYEKYIEHAPAKVKTSTKTR